ncbi:MAG: type II toxin-antitoxin system PrlF family antitoxin [Acidobacteria bacterium]|nr:type II toxin-antitoxin system PrlF family antitoxin [Acidobacteriota bacterium]MCI0624317.1 type II toxin-antitoxin system PrlF family antitoxin [Acidobacteriota bacterium]MCI0723273.1 type II toxin-antitoxin system PrlF family antitoxin [Acidobacteriota bacterium]
MPSATLTSKGQTTIPKEVRELLKLHPGDRLEFFIQGDGTVVLKPATVDVRDLKGLLARPGMKVVSLPDMNAAIRRRFKARR